MYPAAVQAALQFGSFRLPEQKHTYDPGVFTQMFEGAHGLVSKHSSISEIVITQLYKVAHGLHGFRTFVNI